MPEDIVKNVFANKLVFYMKMKGIKQIDQSRDLHLNSSTVSNWCNGKMMPRTDKLTILADYLGCSVSDLIHDDSGEMIQEYHKTITIDPTIDKTHPVYIIQSKLDSGEKLTQEELSFYKNYIANSIPSLKNTLENSMKEIKKAFSNYYAVLNDEGQEEADKKIEQIIKRVVTQAEEQARTESENQIKLLTRIPEYQKKDEPQE